MSISTQSQREEAYRARFGSAHPTRAQVLAWAKDLFPEMKMLRLKTVDGRTALLNNRDVLGVGADPVEAVASADIAKKQATAKAVPSNANTTPETLKATMNESANTPSAAAPELRTITIDDIRAGVARVTRALSAVNAELLKAPIVHETPEVKELNLSVIDLNQLVGTPIQPLPVDSIPGPVNPKPNLATSDPKEIAKALE